MNLAAYLACIGGFLFLPLVLLGLRLANPKWMPWWLVVGCAAFLGWLLANGYVYFCFEHLDDLVRSYGENPPPELVDRLTCDGAARVFALFFGWAYGLIYLTPWVLIYSVIVWLRRRARYSKKK